MGPRRTWALMAAVALLLPAGCAHTQPKPVITVIQVGPLQAEPPRTFADLVADTALVSVVEAHIREVGPLQWHRGDIVYPYCLVHVTVERNWKQSMATDLAVRVFGGMEGDRKYISAIQPDPLTLKPSMRVLLFVSPPSEIDPGVSAATIEQFFFIDRDRLSRFDGTAADVGLAEAEQILDHAALVTASG